MIPELIARNGDVYSYRNSFTIKDTEVHDYGNISKDDIIAVVATEDAYYKVRDFGGFGLLSDIYILSEFKILNKEEYPEYLI